MLGSYSHYFFQDLHTLSQCRDKVIQYLILKGYELSGIAIYLKAFDYFVENPKDYDGATIVRDLCDIDGLDLDAMLHDFHYIEYNVTVSINLKWKADFLYAKGNVRKSKKLDKYWVKFLGMKYIAYSRLVGLTIANVGFIPFARIKRGKVTKEQRELFLADYKCLIS